MREEVREGSQDVVGERSFSPVIVPLILQTASRVSFNASTSLEMLSGSMSSPDSSPSVITSRRMSSRIPGTFAYCRSITWTSSPFANPGSSISK